MHLVRAETPNHINDTRLLFREYEQFLAVDLCFQNFEQELAGLPGKYAPPEGLLLLVMESHRAAGCVAVRKLAGGVCEMKRLYVRPEYRKHGVGRMLAKEVIAEASVLGYQLMRLDTLERLTEAMSLYESLGFRRTPPYYDNPLPGVVYWELCLVNVV
jgi:ribosomal protein S18 acetylase RimI-like enzyme